ncbi:MAG: DUF2849 domain-containing protein [Alphaproteobacteria bacterium]
MTARIATANRLRDGVVVYLGADGRWGEKFASARIAGDAAGVAVLEGACADAVRGQTIVEPYLIEVKLSPAGQPTPIGWRETIRANGPTVLGQSGPRAAEGGSRV